MSEYIARHARYLYDVRKGKHAGKTKRRGIRKSVISVILIAELLCVPVATCTVFNMSLSHIFATRGFAFAEAVAALDMEAIESPASETAKFAKEQIKEERDEIVWTKSNVSYRKGPGKSYDAVGTLYMSAAVRRIGITYNKWSQVLIDGEKYYIKSKELTTEKPLITETGAKGDYQRYALSLFPDYGWADSEITPLINLWNRESGWNPNSHNKSTGAHGIPQALPASKMASEGSDYYTNGNTQIRWGLGYIKGRYGSPSKAWSHFQSHGWY